jgi:hypothetical protein
MPELPRCSRKDAPDRCFVVSRMHPDEDSRRKYFPPLYVLKSLINAARTSDSGSALNSPWLALGPEFTETSSTLAGLLLSKTVQLETGTPTDLESVISCVFASLSRSEEMDHSIVAMLSTEKFSRAAAALLDDELAVQFRLMLFAASLAHTYQRPLDQPNMLPGEQGLRQMAYAMGSGILINMDSLLVPHRLAKLSATEMRILVLVVLGIACSTAYSVNLYNSPELELHIWLPSPADGGPSSRTLWHAMQQHLLSILAHYLVLLSSRLGVEFSSITQRNLIESLHLELVRRGGFVWETPELTMVKVRRIAEISGKRKRLRALKDLRMARGARRSDESVMMMSNTMCSSVLDSVLLCAALSRAG